MTASAQTYRPDVDGLRAVAVLSVLFYHAGFASFSGGFVGVDVFFVISGFLITRLIVNEVESSGGFRFARFYLRRARRLLPALYFTLAASTVFAVLLLSPPHLELFSESLLGALLSVSNIVFWNDAGYFATESALKPLLHTWSLGVEEQFYLVWPALLVWALKRRPRAALELVIAVAAVSLVANQVFSDGLTDLVLVGDAFEDGAATIFYLLPFRAFELAMGATLVWLMRAESTSNAQQEIMLVTGLALIAWAVFRFNEDLVFPSYPALVPCAGAALAIYGGRARYCGRLLSNRAAVRVGLISYSLYLIHWPILVFWGYWKFDTLDTLERSLALLAAVLVAELMYRFVEQPLRSPASTRTRRPLGDRRFLIATVLASGVLAGVSAHVLFHDGWRWRSPTANLSPELWSQIKHQHKFHEREYGGRGYPRFAWFGTPKPSADLILIGDSHGRHFAAGLDRYVVKPLALAAYNGAGASCLHMPGFTRISKGADWDAICPRSLGNALEVMDASANAVVVVGHSWSMQMRKASRLEHGKSTGEKVTIDTMIAGLAALKARIGDRTLVVFGDVPASGTVTGVIHQLLRPTYLLGAAAQAKMTDTAGRARAQAGRALAMNARLRAAAHTIGYVFLDPMDALCDRDRCTNLDDQGRLIYSDPAHLSRAGSRYVVGYFAATVRKLVESAAAATTPRLETSHATGQD